MSDTPAFFRLGAQDSTKLPIGAEFECVYAPESTLGSGWQRVRMRVVMATIRDRQHRMYQPIGVVDIDEREAAALFAVLGE